MWIVFNPRIAYSKIQSTTVNSEFMDMEPTDTGRLTIEGLEHP